MIITGMSSGNVVSLMADYQELKVLKLALLNLNLDKMQEELIAQGYSMLALGVVSQVAYAIDNLEIEVRKIREAPKPQEQTALEHFASGLTVN